MDYVQGHFFPFGQIIIQEHPVVTGENLKAAQLKVGINLRLW
jgi:hypothetical protein